MNCRMSHSTFIVIAARLKRRNGRMLSQVGNPFAFYAILLHRWTDQYSKVCTLYCDLTAISPEPMTNPSGRQYYKVVYDVILKFGLTEFQAYVAWIENVCQIFPPKSF